MSFADKQSRSLSGVCGRTSLRVLIVLIGVLLVAVHGVSAESLDDVLLRDSLEQALSELAQSPEETTANAEAIPADSSASEVDRDSLQGDHDDLAALVNPMPSETPNESGDIVAAALWRRFRDGMQMSQCRGVSERDIESTLGAPSSALMKQWRGAAPEFELVLHELSTHGLPSEWAFLPMVESGYRNVEGQGAAPAGIWQLVPITAKGFGLSIDARIDERRHLVLATDTAIALLKALRRSFPDDWQLVDYAYNAGEFRVRGAIAKQGTRKPKQLDLSPITHQHWAKLNAWSCWAKKHKHFGLKAADTLGPQWRMARLQHDLPRTLVDHLSGATKEFERFNPAHASDAKHWIVPARVVDSTVRLSEQLAQAKAKNWQWQSLASDEDLDRILTAWKIPAEVGIDLQRSIAITVDPFVQTQWLLPSAPLANTATESDLAAPTHTVRAGDSLWRIAKQYGIALRDLQRWNNLTARTVLRIGQHIRLGTKP